MSAVIIRKGAAAVRIVQSVTLRGGGEGSDAAPLTFNQSSAAAEWVINHNRGYRPLIQVLSPGGIEVEAQVVHSSLNQARIQFSQPQSGIALVR